MTYVAAIFFDVCFFVCDVKDNNNFYNEISYLRYFFLLAYALLNILCEHLSVNNM